MLVQKKNGPVYFLHLRFVSKTETNPQPPCHVYVFSVYN